jgi:hypothetical protein
METEIPRYRVSRAVRPAAFPRVRHETPWTWASSDDPTKPAIWQYADRVIEAGEIIETDCWPSESAFWPLNESARKVLHFYRSAVRSRLPLKPYRSGELVLDDGVSGKVISHIPAARPTPWNDGGQAA